MSAPVSTDHPAANEAIEALRNAASVLKELGDENLRLQDEIGDLRDEVSTIGPENDLLTRDLDAAENRRDEAVGQVEEWRLLLEDFRRGIRDADELIERTVGR